jgi:hypothetical protein
MAIDEMQRRELEYRLGSMLENLYTVQVEENQRFVHRANAAQLLREIEAWGYELVPVGITLQAPTAHGTGVAHDAG